MKSHLSVESSVHKQKRQTSQGFHQFPEIKKFNNKIMDMNVADKNKNVEYDALKRFIKNLEEKTVQDKREHYK
jgi:hypothetical protein